MNGRFRTQDRLVATGRWLLSLGLLLSMLAGYRQPAPPVQAQTSASPRRVNVPFAEQVDWAQSAIFWFGQNEQGVPGRNYADVRLLYTATALRVRVVVADYYLWYPDDPGAATDLTQYDAVAIYLDTGFDRAATPQTDDFYFLVGAHHWPNDNATQYHRQARGNGAGWDGTWSGAWTDYEGLEWFCDPGPNSNVCGIDYGWYVTFTLPWETLGLAGPPGEGAVWGLGVLLHDRDDQPPAGYVAPEAWPEAFNAASPATWGQLHFGYADYAPPSATPEGTTTIRAASPTDDVVQDAWMGGGGGCAGGHNGGSEINHGDDTGLYVGSETRPTHFPCFNKTYLRFALDALPAGKSIISATLTLHLWGHAGETPDLAQPSWVHLFTIGDPWDEMSIHWNNAPLAQENVAATWVNPYSGDRADPDWPGDPYSWDATQAVAEAYAGSRPLSVALYGSDTEQHSSKYLTASETGDWNAEGRPTLTVVWGASPATPQTTLDKQVWPASVTHGDSVTYTLSWLGVGQPLTMTDSLPIGLSDPNSLDASTGSASYDPAARRVTWMGAPDDGQAVTVTFAAGVQIGGPTALHNTALLTASGQLVASDSTALIIDGHSLYLPLVLLF